LRLRRVFLLSLVLMALLVLVAWGVVRFSAPRDGGGTGADDETLLTVLQGDAVRSVRLSDWLPGVVAAEMPASFEPEALRELAREAITRKTGARGLRAICEEILKRPMFELPGRKDVERVVVHEDCVANNALPEYVPRT
jgi:ATP-dependent protease Clp ATPase subunit